jgi:hypothetical protein
MPFFLYDIAGEPGRERYSSPREIRLAGRTGPLATFSRVENPTSKQPFGWHATSGDLIRLIGGTPTEQAIVIDLKPRVAYNVSLYRLLDVWGFSYTDWTPIAIGMQTLFADRKEPNPATFKNDFLDPGTDHRQLGEFLYLLGGVSKGTWNWGMIGRVNGALLYPDAFEYLVAGLTPFMSAKKPTGA